MVESQNKQSVYGAQPRSLHINWMKYDVTNTENIHPNTEQTAQRLSPLRLKLQERADQVLQKRQLLTSSEIEKRIQEARLRRDHSCQEAQIRRMEPKVRRSQAQHMRHSYLSEMARKRNEHEESKMSEYQSNIQRIREREASIHSTIAEVDQQSEHESHNGQAGLAMLAQMNGDLESLIRNVYQKIIEEQKATQTNNEMAPAAQQQEPIEVT